MARYFKIALTGGPCGGKTTGQARLASFFETLGWKVYRSPEVASILLLGGVKFSELDDVAVYEFQRSLIHTMMAIEGTYEALANAAVRSGRNSIIICDRGVMDASAYMSPEQWKRLKEELKLTDVDLRDGRYDQVVHLVTAAVGAEAFYSLANNAARTEGFEMARELDQKCQTAWCGHPALDVIDNASGFDEKMLRLIAAVCQRIGLDTGDRLQSSSSKRKFLLRAFPKESEFAAAVSRYEDFEVVSDFLANAQPGNQARIRRRGQRFANGSILWTFQHTVRTIKNDQMLELRTTLNQRDYWKIHLTQLSPLHASIYKKRRCFLWKNQYFHIDLFTEENQDACRGLIFLETYTTKCGDALELPPFLKVEEEVTSKSSHSMLTLATRRLSFSQRQTSSQTDVFDGGAIRESNSFDRTARALYPETAVLNGKSRSTSPTRRRNVASESSEKQDAMCEPQQKRIENEAH